MLIKPEQRKIFAAFVISLLAFCAVFVAQKNTEFIGYVVVVILLLLAVLVSNKHVLYPNYVLWGLFAWAFLHMLGGVEMSNGKVFYTLMLVPIIDEPYSVLKYDQLIHALGFFMATLVMYCVLIRYLIKPFWLDFNWDSFSNGGLGLGALNEIIEFMMVVLLPNTNVGGYENTAIDLIANFIGAVLAVLVLRYRSLAAE